jgi:deazaflavin-dependent oxidoreductase (nitroreductase family)
MANQDEIHDSPSTWVRKHIDSYVETDGEEGHEWKKGVPTLLLTTRGRKSGKLRRTALIYGTDSDKYMVVASRGGAKHHPAWYLNLRDNPEVEVQVGADKFTARAHTATPDEKARLWPVMAKIWPAYNDYQKKTEREIPVVVLERVG